MEWVAESVVNVTARIARVRFRRNADPRERILHLSLPHPARASHTSDIAAHRGIACAALTAAERSARTSPRGPRATTRQHPAELTTRELEVLNLLAAGLRNSEIAARLVVSPKTVDHHVSAILRKLGVRNRCEASVAAHNLGVGRHTDSAAREGRPVDGLSVGQPPPRASPRTCV